DDAVAEALHEGRAQDLHVARQHDQVDALALQQLNLFRLLLQLGLGRDRQDQKWDRLVLGDPRQIGPIADDQPDVAGQLAAAMAPEQVVQAVVILRHEDGDAPLFALVVQPQIHAEALRDLGERALQRTSIGQEPRKVEADALKKLSRRLVAVLIGVEDVCAMPATRPGRSTHETSSVAIFDAPEETAEGATDAPGIADPPGAVSASMAQRDTEPMAGSGGAERAGGAEEQEAPAKLLPAGT